MKLRTCLFALMIALTGCSSTTLPYKPVSQPYSVDFKRWDRDYHKDMDAWIKILRESR